MTISPGLVAGVAACAALLPLSIGARAQEKPEASKPKSPIVFVVGCAKTGAQPHVWQLTNAGARTESPGPTINKQETEEVAKLALGQDSYELIGVADFVDSETSRKIGARGDLLTAPRVNTTGKLANGRKIAVKGLFIAGSPARINLTSVVDLAPTCP